ncbi:endolytic transglycosylase MltG [Leeia oryzae]|uniref:endolytic transglycosylase MltG n=1 Tax=Leeia oryzae TaxID=356662 RepID=UPI000374FECD|nr:endolytic transglycosylase MltG [Leeia oryzae]
MSRLLSRLAAILVLVAVIMGISTYTYLTTPLEIDTKTSEFTITAGSSVRSISEQLTQQGILPDAWRFTLLVRLSGQSKQIKAGSYALSTAPSPLQLLEKLTSGDVTESSITLIEGWTLSQILQSIQKHPDLQNDLGDLAPGHLASILGIPAEVNAEGIFFPDTYHFAKGSKASSVLKRAYGEMQKLLQQEWSAKADNLPVKTPYEALTLASLIEKETGVASDRPMISAVFNNRLKIGMRLQTDPSVIYGLGSQFNGNLTKAHLQTDTPYNTYTRAGLPPSPIAIPSLESIHAALHPADSKALYFVARGDGSSVFSDTLEAHNRAVAKYQR